jgi:hypothetical protein
MIVPNSQLISQNVRNATMGNAQGVVTVALTFPTDIDPEQVRNVLLSAYHEHESILETPAPYVRFSQLGLWGGDQFCIGQAARETRRKPGPARPGGKNWILHRFVTKRAKIRYFAFNFA